MSLVSIYHNEEEIKLEQKQMDFARYYAHSGDALNSRLRAGYKNCATQRANSQNAYLMLQKKNIILAVEYFRKKLSDKIDISENRILAEIASIGFSNVAQLFEDNGDLKPMSKLDTATKRAIKSVTVKQYSEGGGGRAEDVNLTKIDMHPKMQALERLAEIKGMKKVDDADSRAINVTVHTSGNVKLE